MKSISQDENTDDYYVDLDIQKLETKEKPESYFELCKPLLDEQYRKFEGL